MDDGAVLESELVLELGRIALGKRHRVVILVDSDPRLAGAGAPPLRQRSHTSEPHRLGGLVPIP
jgi:hypothetical protein